MKTKADAYTPEMFGAAGNGAVNDAQAFRALWARLDARGRT